VTRYRTIVADPPWRYRAPLPAQHGRADARIAKSENRDVTRHSTTPYDTMTVGEIASIPVGEWAENNAHLYLWTTTTHLPYAFEILDIVEQVSPGPYLEMFARRARFGWDYWGNESLGTAEVAA
jgi:N6-adenosine-specific RNA methylase IME4